MVPVRSRRGAVHHVLEKFRDPPDPRTARAPRVRCLVQPGRVAGGRREPWTAAAGPSLAGHAGRGHLRGRGLRAGDAIMLPSVGYGTLSGYREVMPGTYTVSMRRAGDAPSTPPVLSTVVDVQPGSARTVTGLGAFADLALKVLDDDLTLPPPDRARMRVMAAGTARDLDATLAGTTVATHLAPGNASGYALV